MLLLLLLLGFRASEGVRYGAGNSDLIVKVSNQRHTVLFQTRELKRWPVLSDGQANDEVSRDLATV